MEKAPKKVKAPEGCRGFTSGKEYDVVRLWGVNHEDDFGFLFIIIDDSGIECWCVERGCSYIDEKDWIVTEREQ